MLRILADAFRHQGPVGGLFVLVLVALLGGVLFLPGLLMSNNLGFALFLLLVFGGLGGLFLGAFRRRRPDTETGPIHLWPRLGQNDRWSVRSKLLKPPKRK